MKDTKIMNKLAATALSLASKNFIKTNNTVKRYLL